MLNSLKQIEFNMGSSNPDNQPDTNVQHILNYFNFCRCLNQPIRSAYSERSRLACSLLLDKNWMSYGQIRMRFSAYFGSIPSQVLRMIVLRHLRMQKSVCIYYYLERINEGIRMGGSDTVTLGFFSILVQVLHK